MIIVAVVVLGFFAIILAAFAIPAVAGAITRAQQVQALNNARQIYLAMQSINIDNEAKGRPEIWPSMDGKISSVTALVNELRLDKDDAKRLLTAPGIAVSVQGEPGSLTFQCEPNPAFRFYAVGDRPGDGQQVFISSGQKSDQVRRETIHQRKAH